jgi:caffeoyl-CoA O-methyltransferase
VPDPKSFVLDAALHDYLVAHGTPPDSVQRRLIADTRSLGGVSVMQIAPEQGALLTLLARLTRARSIVEVGTFTGYSSLCLARGLEPDGRLLCCDVSEEWTALAAQAWRDAGVDHLIDLVIAPAIETLRGLPDERSIDLAFIDADKGGYVDYYQELLRRLRPTGLLVVDNVLWSGKVIDAEAGDDDTEAIRAFNDLVRDDARVEVVMLPVADGISLIRPLG